MAGIAFVILGWIVAGIVELLIAWLPPDWSAWFPEQLVDLLLSAGQAPIGSSSNSLSGGRTC